MIDLVKPIIEHVEGVAITDRAVIPIETRLFMDDGRPIIRLSDTTTFGRLGNTQEFREAGRHFMKHGTYTKAPIGSQEYKSYWARETERCLKGMWSGDIYISGKYYFYLNYVPILRVPSTEYLRMHPNAPRNQQVKEFPEFWEIDYCWFNLIEYCEQQAQFGRIDVHKCVLKTRQAGFSFKEAAEGVWNFAFLRNLTTKYFAATEEYLTKDGIFNKVGSMLNHLNAHTHWRQQRSVDNKWHKKATWIDRETKVEKGRFNELIAQVMNDPEDARGGNSVKITFEESGNNKHLLRSWNISLPQVRKSGIVTGFMTAFGTGGTEKADYISGLTEMYYNPKAYECIAFDNIWDEGLQGTQCGFFAPCYSNRQDAMDENGCVDIKLALEKELNDRAPKVGSKGYNQHCAENPITPTEALTPVKNTLFDFLKVSNRIASLGRDKVGMTRLIRGMVERSTSEDGKERYEFMPTGQPVIDSYPISRDLLGTHTGMVRFEAPMRMDGVIPDNLYVIGFDPYYKDDAPSSESVGASYVFKRRCSPRLGMGDMPVAWYVARPNPSGNMSGREVYWNNLILLAKYYNAKIQFEIDGGGQAFFDWAKKEGHLHWLYSEPEMLHNKEISGNSKNLSYGVRMGVGNRKEVFLGYLSEWLEESVVSETGGVITNLDKIMDCGLLYELQKYKEDGNFDRISALCLIIMMCRELSHIEIEESKNEVSDFFGRKLFSNNYHSTAIVERY